MWDQAEERTKHQLELSASKAHELQRALMEERSRMVAELEREAEMIRRKAKEEAERWAGPYNQSVQLSCSRATCPVLFLPPYLSFATCSPPSFLFALVLSLLL